MVTSMTQDEARACLQQLRTGQRLRFPPGVPPVVQRRVKEGGLRQAMHWFWLWTLSDKQMSLWMIEASPGLFEQDQHAEALLDLIEEQINDDQTMGR